MQAGLMPDGFCDLDEIDSSIIQDIRYATHNNFVGRPIAGYLGPRCIVSVALGQALAKAQADARRHQLSLKVYDAYRPQKAVDDFAAWAQDPTQQQMKAAYYPEVDKSTLFDIGFIAHKSQHSRGCAVDLTLVQIPAPDQTPDHSTRRPAKDDHGLEMGTGFDVFDELSHTANPKISPKAQTNRSLLVELMSRHGFSNYSKEWWHFSLIDEPFPGTYFDFDVA